MQFEKYTVLTGDESVVRVEIKRRRACRVNKLAKLRRCVSRVSVGSKKFGPSKHQTNFLTEWDQSKKILLRQSLKEN